jgi:type II secretory pathway pseudopilin PulG
MTKGTSRAFGVSDFVIPSAFGIRASSFVAMGAFTLIELIVVIAIIIVLAGLILSTVGYVQKKGARARAETEIAAISAACESYKADNGVYPTDSGTTETLRPNVDPDGGDPASASFLSSGRFLYPKISGDTDGNPSNGIEGKGYFAGAEVNMLSPNPAGQIRIFVIHLEMPTATRRSKALIREVRTETILLSIFGPHAEKLPRNQRKHFSSTNNVGLKTGRAL